jgi:hypothetical protein
MTIREIEKASAGSWQLSLAAGLIVLCCDSRVEAVSSSASCVHSIG